MTELYQQYITYYAWFSSCLRCGYGGSGNRTIIVHIHVVHSLYDFVKKV